MKKVFVIMIIAALAVMSLTACGPRGELPISEIGPSDQITYEDMGEELPDGMEKTYELALLEYYNSETGEWEVTDFIPGAEKYVFHEDLTCEYVYKNYPTEEDMLNDSNYEMVTKNGFYLLVPEENGITMLIDGFPVAAGFDDNVLIVEQDYNGSPAVRSLYTEAEQS